MKPNRFRQVLAAGGNPTGHFVIEFTSRGLARILDSADPDFVVFDMEHSGIDFDQIADQLAWTHGCSYAPFVRVPQAHYHFLSRVLDAGALGVMVANVESAEDAAAIVDAVKYPPEGRRGLAPGLAHNDYRLPDVAAYLAEANESTVVICQIESPRGVANADAIAAVPGVDVLWIGHYDLTANLGIVGQFDHPEFHRSLAHVVAAAKRHGKQSAILPGNEKHLAEWAAHGFSVLCYGADAWLYQAALAKGIARAREAFRKS